MPSHNRLLEREPTQQQPEALSRRPDRPRFPAPAPACSFCLIPFDRREGLTTAEAAARADRTERTIRMWCRDHDIGRRVAGGPWLVSRVALAMLLNDDTQALRAYLRGDRHSGSVADYFAAEELDDLVVKWNSIEECSSRKS